ncbi:hypothetical protein SAMN04488112_10957 [Melghirimyces thermohalophilus]|uniref:Acetyltransferase (GNAT) family protein n=2 Tax=Melghirimyces thermohalophilus TaxID=1236220 RepID=A0A1G6M8U9_9BACL|nr:hypothetical protein SAMN04488112_10957 [Melghirimyces thermohalophilus]
MYVATEARNRGMGQALLKELLRRAEGLVGLENPIDSNRPQHHGQKAVSTSRFSMCMFFICLHKKSPAEVDTGF